MTLSSPLVVASTLVISVVVLVVAGFGIQRRRYSRADESEEASESTLRSASPQLSIFDSEDVDDARAIDPRIFLPDFTDATDDVTEQVLAFACSIKHRYGDEPVHLLRIDSNEARAGTGDSDTDSSTPNRFSGLEVAKNTAIHSETTESEDVPATVVRTVDETETDLVVMGDESTRASEETAFGRTADHILAETSLPTYLVHLDGALSEKERLHVVVPQHIDHHEGFYEAIYNVKQLASTLEASVTVWVFEQNVQHYRTLFDLVEIDVLAEFASVQSWDELYAELELETAPDEFVITLAVRSEKISWDPELESVSTRLTDVPARSSALCFLREDEPEHDDRFLRTE